MPALAAAPCGRRFQTAGSAGWSIPVQRLCARNHPSSMKYCISTRRPLARWDGAKNGRHSGQPDLCCGPDFDLVIDLQGLFKSAVMAWFTGCPHRIGYCEMREGSCLVSRPITGPNAHDHVIERYLDVARYLGAKVEKITYPMPALAEERKTIRRRLQEAGMPEGEKLPYVVLVPGARWETKRWPTGHYAALARKFLAEGIWVVLAGGPGMRPGRKDPGAGGARTPSFGLDRTDQPPGALSSKKHGSMSVGIRDLSISQRHSRSLW